MANVDFLRGSNPASAPIADGNIFLNKTTGELYVDVDSTRFKINNKSTVLSGTLTAGQTTLTFTNVALTATAMVDVYTDTFGVSPTDVDGSTVGTCVLTFPEQAANVAVKLIVTEV